MQARLETVRMEYEKTLDGSSMRPGVLPLVTRQLTSECKQKN